MSAPASRREARPRQTQRRNRNVRSLALTVLALAVALYFTFQIVGLLFRLAFLAAVVLLALAALRAWRDGR